MIVKVTMNVLILIQNNEQLITESDDAIIIGSTTWTNELQSGDPATTIRVR